MSEPPAAPVWRQQPYRVFFPLGLVLVWAGVLPWLLYGLGIGPYRPLYHAFTQIQGFLACFALGFLFTMIPRRTGTRPPSPVEMLIGLSMPVGTTVASWFGARLLAQACWLVLVGMLLAFAVRRFGAADATRRPPNSFVWVPIAILMGSCGSVLVTLGDLTGLFLAELDRFGRLLLLQGTFLGLVLGVGGMVLPLMTCGDSPPDSSPTDRRTRLAHVGGAVVLVASFAVEAWFTPALGLALRAIVVTVVIALGARLYRTPRRPGWHRWLIWLSGWLIPTGYVVAASWPAHLQAGLHVVFLGGFALMALSVGLHVTLAHGGRQDLVAGRPWQVPVFGVLLATALVFRILVQAVPEHRFTWFAWSAGSFLLATVAWATLALPYQIRGNRTPAVTASRASEPRRSPG